MGNRDDNNDDDDDDDDGVEHFKVKYFFIGLGGY